MNNCLRNLHPTLIAENGGAFGFVSIWRDGDRGDTYRKCTVGEWLSRPENQSGEWRIDGGWGGPPGPIHVRWNEAEQVWENGGYGGRGFKSRENNERPPNGAPVALEMVEVPERIANRLKDGDVVTFELKGNSKRLFINGIEQPWENPVGTA